MNYNVPIHIDATFKDSQFEFQNNVHMKKLVYLAVKGFMSNNALFALLAILGKSKTTQQHPRGRTLPDVNKVSQLWHHGTVHHTCIILLCFI